MLDESAFAFFDGQRRLHFPPERNLMGAHVTLFHHLPGEHLAAVEAVLAAESCACAPFSVAVAGLRLLGRGVAYRLDSPVLDLLRAGLASHFRAWLTPQDAQRFQPHVTIQNKVDPAQARALKAVLETGFKPWKAKAEGLQLWRYLGGPWEAVETFRFRGAASDDFSDEPAVPLSRP